MVHKTCYGGMFPQSLVRSPTSRSTKGKVFDCKQNQSVGQVIPNQETFEDLTEWDDCVACEEFEHCYKFCMAKLCFNHVINR